MTRARFPSDDDMVELDMREVYDAMETMMYAE
jgi:hypothetical protein